jgi:large subunit ribosomal protein L27e
VRARKERLYFLDSVLIPADTHIMPTRYTIELENLKGVLSQDTFKEVSQREEAKKVVKKAFEERYTSGKNRWFFTPLQF